MGHVCVNKAAICNVKNKGKANEEAAVKNMSNMYVSLGRWAGGLNFLGQVCLPLPRALTALKAKLERSHAARSSTALKLKAKLECSHVAPSSSAFKARHRCSSIARNSSALMVHAASQNYSGL